VFRDEILEQVTGLCPIQLMALDAQEHTSFNVTFSAKLITYGWLAVFTDMPVCSEFS